MKRSVGKRRWGDWMMGVTVVAAVALAIPYKNADWIWWPPVLATAFALAFSLLVADAHRTGIVIDRMVAAHRTRQRARFKVRVATYLLCATLTGLMAAGLWWNLLRP